MIATGTAIHDYIPQRPPMVMIGSLLYADEMRAVTSLMVEHNNLFVSGGTLSESGLVENIAQTAAAGVGYVCSLQHKKVPVGFIASIRNLVVHELPAAGSEITTEINVTNEVMDVRIISGVVRQGTNILAECEMRIFVKPESTESHG